MRRHGIAFGGAGETWDLVLFYIQFYAHNVMCLNLLFWSMSLFNSSWATTFNFLGGRHHNLALFSKIFSIVWPSFIIAVMQIRPLQDIPMLHIVSTFLTMFISLSLGSILTALVLFKYIRTRRLIAGHTSRGDWWGPSEIDSLSYNDDFSEGSINDSSSIKEGSIFRSKIFNRMRHSIYDRALITRFTICFVIMAGFEVVIIFFTLYQVDSNAGIAASGQPDMSVDTAETEALLFLPGVSASLLAFCVFGTTKSWRAYRDLFSRGRGPRRKSSSPEALDFTILHQQQLT
ncbi:hypothetical protein K3495_g2192 [Podosphaera aphanis]|nr:hypothetical protein K3495_g2192 [Podosphaera aphanis]